MTSLERSNVSNVITQMQGEILPSPAECLSYKIANNSTLLPEKKIMLPHYLAWYVGTQTGESNITSTITSICMDVIDYFGNPKKFLLDEVTKIVQEFVQKAKGSSNILLLYNFNQNVLPCMGVGTHIASSLDEIIYNLRTGNPSLAVLKNGTEVILQGMDSNYCYVIQGNSQQEQIAIKDFQDSLVALWVCSSLKKQAC